MRRNGPANDNGVVVPPQPRTAVNRHRGLPDHVRSELPARGRAGAGHDLGYPTMTSAGGSVSAQQACLSPPSAQMFRLVCDVRAYVAAGGAQHIVVGTDPRRPGLPGALTVRWFKGPTAAEVAGRFAVSHGGDGTPLLPAWLCLRADDDFDLRWQSGY